MNKGLLVILSAPSGCGKDAVLQELAASGEDFCRSVSATTRDPRVGEVHGVDYLFMSRDEFSALAEDNGFLEYAEYGKNCYGTPKAPVDRLLSQGKTVVLKIETQGAYKVMDMYPDAVSIFIVPPSMKALEERLRGRGTDDEDSILIRLQTAKVELEKAPDYNYIVVNDELPAAAKAVSSIIAAERCKTNRNTGLIKDLIEEVQKNA